jgi:hypothetical protein
MTDSPIAKRRKVLQGHGDGSSAKTYEVGLYGMDGEDELSMCPAVRDFLSQWYSKEQLHEMLTAMRRPPSTTIRVNTLATTRVEALKLVQAHLTTLAGGAPPGTEPMQATAPAFPPDCIEIKGGGPIVCEVGDVSKVVVIERKAGEMVMRGAHVFAPGVIATSQGICEGDRVQVLAFASNGTPPTTGTVLKDKPDAPHARKKEGAAEEGLGRPSTVAEMKESVLLLGIGIARMGRKQMFNLKSRHAGLHPAVELVYGERVWLAPSFNGCHPDLLFLQVDPTVIALLTPTPL